MNEEILKWLQSEDDSYINKIYKTIYPTILTMVKGNQLFRINRFSNEEAEEWAHDILLRLNKVRKRIELKGFFGFARRVIINYLIDRINERRDDDGVIPVSIEIPETLSEEAVDENEDTRNPEFWKIKKLGVIEHTKYFQHLQSFPENTLFLHLKKWALWYNKDFVGQDSDSVVPKTDLRRIAFTNLEPAGYNVFYNPTSILSKYDLWLNHNLADRDYMWSAIDSMILSKKEARSEPKADPMVGAVLVDENGYIIASSYRGKNVPKGHCEYNLIEFEIEGKYIKEKYIVPPGSPGAGASVTRLNIKNATLYVTLEPCSKRSSTKCSCADRIIYSGIKKVFVGLRDPDSSVDGSGIRKMQDAGIEVNFFHQDLIFEIINSKNGDGELQNLDFVISKKAFYLNEQPEIFVKEILDK